MKKVNEIILTDMMDCSVMPQMVDGMLEEYDKEQERFICKTLTELNIDENILANQAKEIQRLNNLLQEYKDLEEQGLLLRLSCKVGDTLYHILACTTAENFGKKYIDWFIVTHLLVDTTKEMIIMGRDAGNKEWGINGRGIGKTVFLTREEAERKLKEMEG